MDDSLNTCKNCNNIFSGKFCNNCGEKAYSEKDKKISHFFNEFFHFSTHLDGKFFTTIKTIFTSPGKLSFDYCNGVRKKYFKPLSLFLFIIIVYLLFPLAKGLNMKFYTYVSPDYNYEFYANPIVKNKLAHKNLTLEELSVKYDTKSQGFAKPFLLLLLPLSGLLLFALFFKKRKFFFDHFVFAIEINSVIISVMFLIFPFLARASVKIFPSSEKLFQDGGVFSYAVLIFLLTMVSFAVKRFYGQNWFWTIFKSLIFLSLFVLVIIDFIYHFLLFTTVNLFI